LASASFQFLAFAVLVILFLNFKARSVAWRQTVLLTASLCFLAFFSNSPMAYVPLAGFLAFGYVGLRTMQRRFHRTGYALFVIGTIGAFVWLKKYTFVPSLLFLPFPYLTLGLSYVFFRVLHLIIEAHDGVLLDRVTPVCYLNYTLNFATLVSGPIQRYEDFASMQRAAQPLRLGAFIAGEAIERIIIGFFKVNVLSLVFSSLHSGALSRLSRAQPFDMRVIAGAVVAVAYTFFLYCNFSGYIDIVIGIARFLRLKLPENFDRPFASDNFLNFWSRWHITLSEWLKSYIYNPLLIGLMRKFSSAAPAPFVGVFALFVTFFIVGVWHGQTSAFIFFGVLQGLGVSVNKLYQILMGRALGRKPYQRLAGHAIYNMFARGLTFTWFTFTLLWFWSNWKQLGALASAVSLPAIAASLLLTFVAASVLLEAWERLRHWLLAMKWNSTPLPLWRYARTVWVTALAVIAVATVLLLHAPAPDIVYKSF
jgi:alginate O-acetyltransferase complex protein AlgI